MQSYLTNFKTKKSALTLSLLGNVSAFSKNSMRNTINVSISLDPNHARQNIRPDLGPCNCL